MIGCWGMIFIGWYFVLFEVFFVSGVLVEMVKYKMGVCGIIYNF